MLESTLSLFLFSTLILALGNSFYALFSLFLYNKSHDLYCLNYSKSFTVFTFAFVFMFLSVLYQNAWYLVLYSAFIIIALHFLLKGVLIFLNTRPGHALYSMLFFFLTGLFVLALFNAQEGVFQWSVYLVIALYYILIGHFFLRTVNSYFKLVGLGFTFLGLLNALYPLTNGLEYVSAILLGLLNTIAFFTVIGLFFLHFYNKHQQLLKKHKTLYYMSYHDHLTGLYNRHYMEKKIMQMEKRQTTPVGVIMGDLNELKTVNDQFGHFQGDALLENIAQKLKALLPTGYIGRYGGDEFLVLLPKVNETETIEIYHLLQTVNDAVKIESIHATIALGYAVKVDSKDSIKSVIIKAEKMMYQQKALMNQKG